VFFFLKKKKKKKIKQSQIFNGYCSFSDLLPKKHICASVILSLTTLLCRVCNYQAMRYCPFFQSGVQATLRFMQAIALAPG